MAIITIIWIMMMTDCAGAGASANDNDFDNDDNGDTYYVRQRDQ